VEKTPVRIVVADPDRGTGRALELALVSEPSIDVVGCAWTGDQAVELATAESADVVLLAVDLPEALTALERLLRRSPKPPKVILMGDDNPRSELLADTAEVAGFMSPTREVAGFVRRTAETSDMVTLVVALVALVNAPLGELNGSKF
jgi:DNA-binding NarL/FixJ family response regulator